MTKEDLIYGLTQGAVFWKKLKAKDYTLREPNFKGADLSNLKLAGFDLSQVNLTGVNLKGSDLTNTLLYEADLTDAILDEATLTETDLRWSYLNRTSFKRAVLLRANLEFANLANADFSDAEISDCEVTGVVPWSVNLNNTKQSDLKITVSDKNANAYTLTVDNLEVAYILHLVNRGEPIPGMIDSISNKCVLILGRFTEERKRVLDALKIKLRKNEYVPILFDFNVPKNRDIKETITLLARISKFIVADLTDPSSIQTELEAIVPDLEVPVIPIIQKDHIPYSMFEYYRKYHWVLTIHKYNDIEDLVDSLAKEIIAPAENKVSEILNRRREV